MTHGIRHHTLSIVPPCPALHEPHAKNLWLFDIGNDPEEWYDISGKHGDIVRTMLQKLADYNATAVPVLFPDGPDPNSFPSVHGGIWAPWGNVTNQVLSLCMSV